MSRHRLEHGDLDKLRQEYAAFIGRVRLEAEDARSFEAFAERPQDVRAVVKWRLRVFKQVNPLRTSYPGMPGISLDTTIK